MRHNAFYKFNFSANYEQTAPTSFQYVSKRNSNRYEKIIESSFTNVMEETVQNIWIMTFF